jgi:23S rRNA (cytidine2498-2'-O)-methyltransferase
VRAVNPRGRSAKQGDAGGERAGAKLDRGGRERRHARRGDVERRGATPAPIPHGAMASPGEFLWTCREGFENDLATELRATGRDVAPRIVAPALVVSAALPAKRDDRYEVTFARQLLPALRVIRACGASDLDAKVTAALRECTGDVAWGLHVWVPDSTEANRFARSAEVLQRAIELRSAAIDARWADRRVTDARAARDAGGVLAQVCLVEPNVAVVGALPARDALSLHPGGRARMRVDDAAPSRAAMKLEEALDWLGIAPEKGEVCVDLGAAPGGWTYVVMQRGARVVAIDPGAMSPTLATRKALTQIRGSAFDYEPREAVDWLLCDMVWRPLEVASLLARWGRKRWARMLVANIKLPMRGKAEFLVRVRKILEEGGWQSVRMRQLYHDREEITLTAHAA